MKTPTIVYTRLASSQLTPLMRDVLDGQNDAVFARLHQAMTFGSVYTFDELHDLYREAYLQNPSWKNANHVMIADALLRLVQFGAVTFESRWAEQPTSDPAAPQEKGFYFVWTKPDHKFPGSLQSPKQTFNSPDGLHRATAAAEGMTRLHPEQKFFVAKAVRVVDREVVTSNRELA